MRRKVTNSSSLIFTKRESDKGLRKRRKKLFSLRRMLSYGIFTVFAFGSIFGGYLFARFGEAPDILENKEPKKVIKPIDISKDIKAQPIEKLLEEQNISFESVTKATTSATLIIILGKDSFAYLDFSQDLEPQVKVLANIMKRVKIENPGKKISYIDLRFTKPIIKF